MTITTFPEMIQGSEEWYAARCGLLTASQVSLILTPTLKIASNDKERSHLYELLAQRITGFVEPTFQSFDMLRGKEDEILARAKYSETYKQVDEVGFVTNDEWGFTLGCSPDGLVGANGMIEAKSRKQKYQIQTIVENVAEDTVPAEYMLQIQASLLVTGRKWCDFISYSGGLPMAVVRVQPDSVMQDAILDAAGKFEERLVNKLHIYERLVLDDGLRLLPTERRADADDDISGEDEE